MPTVIENTRMIEVYDRLKVSGLDTKYVKSVLLPEWWNDSLSDTKSGFLHGLSFIAQRAGVEVQRLMHADQTIACREFGPVKFKKRRQADTSQVNWARNIAASAAELVASIACKRFTDPGSTASQLRRTIEKKTGSKTVTLPALLDVAWDHGIPVIFVGHLPPKFGRMDGMVARFDGRPVIVVSKNAAHSAWMSYIIAHELGHICRGHVAEGIVVDESVEGKGGDCEECEANAFAMELLTGTPDANYNLGSFIPSAIIRKARQISISKHVDPGVVILNHAFRGATAANGAIIKKTLDVLEPDANAPGQICERMAENLDFEGLDEDQRDYLERLASPSSSAVSKRQ
jgi:hypothetical protein